MLACLTASADAHGQNSNTATRSPLSKVRRCSECQGRPALATPWVRRSSYFTQGQRYTSGFPFHRAELSSRKSRQKRRERERQRESVCQAHGVPRKKQRPCPACTWISGRHATLLGRPQFATEHRLRSRSAPAAHVSRTTRTKPPMLQWTFGAHNQTQRNRKEGKGRSAHSPCSRINSPSSSRRRFGC